MNNFFFLINNKDHISLSRNKNYNNLIVTSAFQNLLQILLDIFQKLDLSNLLSKKLILAKRKNISKRKKSSK